MGAEGIGGAAPAMNDYARHEHHDFLNAAQQALADPPLQAALVRLTSTLMAGNRRGYAALADIDALRDHAKRIKEHALAHLDRYLEQLEASLQKRGGHVHWASDAEEARRIVLDIARRIPPLPPTETSASIARVPPQPGVRALPHPSCLLQYLSQM